MRRKRRWAAVICTMALAVTAMTGCTAAAEQPVPQTEGNDSGSRTEADAESISGEITFSFWGIPEEVAVQEAITEEFNKLYPNIKVNLDHVSGVADFNTTILTRISGGTAPDVFYMGEVMSPIYADKGVVEDLLPYAQRDNIALDDYWEGVLSPVGYKDGNMWCFPKDCTPYMVYYNKDIFDEAGLAYPDGTWNFEQFEEVCRKLTVTDDSGKVTRYGIAPGNGWTTWFPFIYKNDGKILDEDGKRLIVDSNAAEALQWSFDLANASHVSTNPDDITTMGAGEVDLFKSGMAAMTIGGRFITYFLSDFTGNYGFTTIPANKSNTAPLNFVALGMAKDSKNKEAAWEFIKFYCGKTGQEINSATGMGMPVMKSVTESGIWMLEGETQEQLDLILKQMEDTKDHPFHPEWMKLIDDIYTRHMTEASRGKITAEEALIGAAEEANKYLEEAGK